MKKLTKENKAKFFNSAFCLIALILLPASVLSGLITAPILITLGVLSLLLLNKNTGNFLSKNKIIIFAFALFLDWALITVIWSIDWKHSLVTWLQLAVLVAFGTILISSAKSIQKNKAERVLEYLFLGIGISLVLFLFQKETNGLLYQAFYKLKGEIREYKVTDMNRAACLLAVIFWPCFIFLFEKYKKYSYLLALSTFLVIFNLESLSAKTGFVAGALTFIFFKIFKAKFYHLLSIAIIIFAGLFVYTISNLSQKEILEQQTNLPHSSIHRLLIWNFSFEKIKEKPVFGFGFDSSSEIPGGQKIIKIENKILDKGWTYLPLHSHNIIMQTWLELGAIGLIILLSSIFILINAIGKSALSVNLKATSFAAIAGYFTIALTGFGMWQFWWVSVIFISGFFIALVNQSLSKARAKSQNS